MKKIIYVLVVLILIFKIKLVFTFECHECKGTDECATPTKKGSWDKEECDSEICAVWIKKDQKTYRGCKPPDDDKEIDQMKLCFVGSCNDFIFPERRAICHTCDGADCIPVPTEEALPCVNYQKDDECYTWIINKNIGYRGCLSDDPTQAENCKNSKTCIRGSPNNQPGFSSQLACVKCEQGLDHPDCYKSIKTEPCAESPLGTEDKCFHIISSDTLIRDCYLEKQDFCDKPGSQCQTCSQTGCNVEPFSSLQCVKCDDSDSNCKDSPQPSSSVSCLSSNPAELACYYKIDNLMNVKRGCVNSLSQAEQTECFENDGNCRICRENNCNRKVKPLQCHKCKSSDEPSCATVVDKSKWETEMCSLDTNECAVWIEKGNEETFRGCRPTDLSEIDQILSCGTDSCNEMVFPGTRIQCHKCKDKNCVRGPFGEALPCVKYANDDECYTFVKDEFMAYRGCMSDDDSPKPEDCIVDSKDVCIKSDTLNNQLGYKDELECVECDLNEKPFNCHNQTEVVKCPKFLLGRPEKPEDECFYLKGSETLIRGCIRKDDNEKKCLDDNDNCSRCGTNGCNVKAFNALECVTCDSANPKCKDDVEDLDSTFCVSQDSNQPACYFWIEGEGTNPKVKRGCVDSLKTDEEKRKCLENKDECRSCYTDKCNQKKKPLECYQCDSSQTKNCATTEDLNLNKSVMCNLDDETCSVWINKGDQNTYRGCKHIQVNQLETMLSCEGDLCNKMIFPENRKQCYQCAKPNCVFIENQYKEMPCRNYDIKDECFTFVASENNANRGCLSDTPTQAKECKENPFCIEGNPNNQPGYTKLKCVKCEQTIENPDCFNKTEVNDCNLVLFGRPHDKCFNAMNGDSLVRGCLQDDQNVDPCKNPNSNCTTCSTDGCNIFPYHVLKCVKCNSNDDWCANNPKKFAPEFCISSDKDELGCYLWKEDDGTVERGCVHTLSPEKRDECLSNSNKCKICSEDACNQKVDFQVCYNCDSKIDENCATLKDAEKLNTLICENYLDHCMESVPDQRTIRGCISSTDTECKGIKCKKCESNFCNNQVIPKSRIKCNRCNETHTKACGQDLSNNDTFSHYCPLYDMAYGDICFSVLDENKKMIRGCRSDSEEYKICKERKEKCGICNSKSKCNFQPSFVSPDLKCIKCTPTDLNCKWGFNTDDAENCTDFVYFGDKEECFIKVYENDVVARGCLNDNKTICDSPNKSGCKVKCNDKLGCNFENVYKEKCIRCDSNTNPSCATARPNMRPEECPKKIQEHKEQGCFTHKNATNNRVIRDCYSRLSEEQRESCETGGKEEKRCNICKATGCNDKAPPNSAIILKFQLQILTLIICLFNKYLR